MCCGGLLGAGVVQGVELDAPCRHVQLEPTPTSARLARKFVTEVVDDLGAEVVDTVVLLTSELVTNGVLHARTPLELGVTRGSDTVLVTVADGAGGTPAPPEQDDGRSSGRGLVLVGSLANDWGVHPLPAGKVTWFTVPAPRPGTDQEAAVGPTR